MSWTRLFSILIFFVSLSLSFFVAEYSYRLIKEKISEDEFTTRTMLFQNGENFKNIEDFFIYYPNKKIRSAFSISFIEVLKI